MTCCNAGTLCFKRFASRGLLASSVWVPRQWLAMLLDQCASAAVVLHLMTSPDTVIVNITAVISVLFYKEFLPDLHMNLTWTAVGFALVFPLQTAIREAFKRREQALMAISDFRATLLNVFLANQLWDWPGADSWYGRAEDNVTRPQRAFLTHVPVFRTMSAEVLDLLMRIIDAMQVCQEFCTWVSAEKELVEEAELKGRSTVLGLLARLHKATEELKAAGMPANEASRINQYNMFLCRDFERLWSFKTYRSPATLRSVSRVNIQLYPFFFGLLSGNEARQSQPHGINAATRLAALNMQFLPVRKQSAVVAVLAYKAPEQALQEVIQDEEAMCAAAQCCKLK
ncbi:unnamed protein product [Symbiodinium natans]|uniref:Uncharacterized protein n=1 Tax=Symbiodinium natans TaxID=878477 RepID=A0A812RT03_9DINO|nr:unnamed protein product [Symbiodinium natans]